MKCQACGYEYEKDWVNGNFTVTNGDDKFIGISLSNDIQVKNDTRENQYTYEYPTLKLYACPKCGTVKIDKT